MEHSISSCCAEASLHRYHVRSYNIYDVARRAFPSRVSLRYDINLSWNVSNRHLVRWLLNLDLLVADELALLYLQDQLTLDLVLFASETRTLNFGRKCFLVNDLINFHTAGITGIDSYLHAWLDISAASDDTFDVDEGTDILRLDVSHSVKEFFATSVLVVALWDDNQAILPLQLRRNTVVVHGNSILLLLLLIADVALIDHHGACLLIIEASLLHYDIKC